MSYAIINPDAPAAYREFWRLWHEDKYFQCHEALEILWQSARGRQRLLLHGLIHGAVALYQMQRGNTWGAARQWTRAHVKLETLRPKYFDDELGKVDLEAWLQSVQIEVEPAFKVLSTAQEQQLNRLESSIRTRLLCEYSEIFENNSPSKVL